MTARIRSLRRFLASVKNEARASLRRSGLESAIGAGHFYPSVRAGVEAYLSEAGTA
jgi:hypothetical protein